VKLSDYVMRFLADAGVKHVFLVVGGGAMHLNESLSRCRELTWVCNLHEQASAIAAEAYAKATGNLGVALVTSGPGGTNALTGVAGAWLDSTPCLFLSGQVKRADRMIARGGRHLGVRQLGVQELDIVSMAKPVAKYAVTVDDPLAIRYHLEKAVHLARTGRPGPVWIDLPLDVQAAPIEAASLAGFRPEQEQRPDPAAPVDAILAALNRAERPLLLAGNGIRLARAEQDFRALVDLLEIPVETTWMPIDLLPDDHPLFAGRPGALAPRGANFAVQNCDFLLAIGARLDRVVTGYSPRDFARAAYKVAVDVDAAELAKLEGAIDLGVCADAGDFLREMLRRRAGLSRPDRGAWRRRCAEWRRRYPVVLPEHRAPEGPVSAYRFSEVLSEELPEGAWIVCCSSGSAIELFLLAFRVRPGQRIIHTAALGAMGFAIPAAVGACLAGGRKPVVAIDGDGGFHLNAQELETVARLKLPIRFFVLNNDGYASIRASQLAWFDSVRIGCDVATGLTLPDIGKIGRAYGIETTLIADQGDLRGRVREAVAHPGPLVCDVRMIRDEARQPRLASVQLEDGSFESKPLEDLWPFLSREELASNQAVPAG
jgi:acetolactate synthase-1/2/3 large subunit